MKIKKFFFNAIFYAAAMILCAGCQTLGDTMVMRISAMNPKNFIAAYLVRYADTAILAESDKMTGEELIKAGDRAMLSYHNDIAIRLYLKAAEKGEPEAYKRLGKIRRRN
ncbi:MAG: hypothetical protein IKO42_05525 [Opitutales bacterium]|nr:hypothetical protein [Opitutales bacterium]